MRQLQRMFVLGYTAVVGLILMSIPAAAAGYDSTTEALIRTLNQQLLYIAVPITILVEVILIYTVIRFRNNDDPKPTTENRRLEITWTVATALILLFVGIASYQVMAHPDVTATPQASQGPSANAVDITIVGHQWYWEVRYPAANVTVQSANTIYVPVNRTIHFKITSADVIHSVHVPGLALKQDAIPGQYTRLQTRITTSGEYQLYCAEFCGAGHSKMTAVIKVVPYNEYQEWLEKEQSQ